MGIKQTLPFLVVLLLSYFTVKPLITQGFFPMHDDTQPVRVQQMAEALRDGQFPVRWVSDLGYGYGYPIFNFYSPLPYYFGGLTTIAGFDVMTATKVMFGVGILLAAFSMFALGWYLWGKTGAVISSLLYIFAPYHGILLYVRGAIGELWAYGFLPFILLGIFVGRFQPKKGALIGSIGLVGVFCSHTISALIVLYFLGLWFVYELIKQIVNKQNSPFLLSILFTLVLGTGLSAFFILPAFFEARFTKVKELASGTNDFHNHFVEIEQLWDSPWGYGGSAPGKADGMSFKIGKIQVILGVIIILLYFAKKELFQKRQSEVALFISGLLISLFMMLSLSVNVWEVLPYFEFIQYPWRMLTFFIFFVSLLAGAHTVWLKKMEKRSVYIVCVLLIAALFFIHVKYFVPQYINSKNSEDYINSSSLKWDISKISDEYLPTEFPIPKTLNDVAKQKIRHSDAIIVEQLDTSSSRISALISASTKAEILFEIAYFPGWEFVVDGTKYLPLLIDGKPVIELIPGRHTVTAYFSNTYIRLLGNMLSIIFIGIYMYLLLKVRYEKN